MKKIYLQTLFLVFLIGFVHDRLHAQVTLADWNFDYEYTTSTGSDSTYYAPTSTAMTSSANITISGSKFKVYPNSQVGTMADYAFNAVSQYCQIRTGYNNYTTRLYFTGPNTISDFTDGSQHANYFQFSLPTKGYDDINMHFSMAGGQNDVNDFLEVVYSTDGGTTWVDAGDYHALSGWWLYQNYDVSISARNKDEVIVRLIGCTENTGDGKTFYLDDFNVTGTSTTISPTATTITWPFDLSTDGQTAAYSDSSYFNQDDVTVGSNLIFRTPPRTSNGITFSWFTLTNSVTTPDADNMIGFSMSPKTALSFTPTTVSFDCQKYGTSGGLIDVIWKSSDGTSTTIATDLDPLRDGTTGDPHVTYDLTSMSIPASDGSCTLELYVHSMSGGKLIEFANIVVEGTISGTLMDVTQYTVSTAASPTTGGSVSSNKPATVDGGTEVTLTATPEFGYSFSQWEDGGGNQVATDNPLTFTVDSDTSLTAVFASAATYSLNTTIVGGANDYMVTASPNDHNWEYEAGDNVTLTAMSNPIITFTDWSTGETMSSITVTMDGDKTITANYVASDYIVGWDFYASGNNNRVADFSDSTINDAAALVMRKADGTTSSWLDFSYENQGASGWHGENCAIKWKQLSDQYYYQISFDASGYRYISIQADLLGSYNYYDVQNCEYSLDGTNWTTLGTYNLSSANTWYANTFNLPEEANYAPLVYIRWIPDYGSTAQGSGNDGTSISAIYVTGTKAELSDQTISFPSIQDKVFGDSDFDPGATASSGLPISYTSSDENVATVVDGKIHLTGVGTVTITASQAGNIAYKAADDVQRTFTIEKGDQHIYFVRLGTYQYTEKIRIYAIASSGLPVTLTSTNENVAVIDGKYARIVGVGLTHIIASQPGDENYNPAASVSKILNIEKTDQTISLDPIDIKLISSPDFDLAATASSGLEVTYTSSDENVATVVDGVVHIVGAGTAEITASQAGDLIYNSATAVQTITVLGNGAKQELANWNFDNEYSTEASADSTFYTPSKTALVADPSITISNSKFAVYPDSYVGAASDYTFNAVTKYTQLRLLYQSYAARIMFQGPSSVTDFSNENNHKNYFQFSFPTTGYDSISVDFSFSSGQNSAEDFLEMVYSTDGGASWIDAGSYYPTAQWWVFTPYSVPISARDKENVIVRLIGCTNSSSGTANFNLDYFKLNGAVYLKGESVDANGTITWPFDLGTAGQMATYSEGIADYFNADYVSNGINLAYIGTRETYGIIYTRFQPAAQVNTPDADNQLSFNIQPKNGLDFTPTAISFDCQRYGTDGGLIDVIWKTSDGTEITVASELKPARDNSGDGTHAHYDLTGLNIPASDGECSLILDVYALGNTKAVGLANVIIDGNIEGTINNVPSYRLTTSVMPEGAGSISSSPVGNEFDMGTEVTLTAKPNFGYEFSHWVNDQDESVSSDNPYTFTVSSDTSLTAIFSTVNTYSLNASIVGGANDYMVTASPNDHDWVYEAGDMVTLTAVNNPIFTFSNWSTGETTSSINVTMDGDKTITANYDALDYIVGWDFYVSGSNNRVADFSDSTINDAAALVMRNADGTASGWLDFSNEKQGAGGWHGQNCAIKWKQLSDQYYYQISFDASGHTDISVQADMLGSYNYYDVQNCEYSLDGTNWTTLGTYDLSSANTWYSNQFDLPAAANNAPTVYIRWIPDYSSTAQGSGNDGTSISGIYVYTTAGTVENHAPVLAGSLDPVSIDKGTIKEVTIPSDLFVDEDAGDILSYTLTNSEGGALPSWISFDPASMKVTLSPAQDEIGSHTFNLTATDKGGLTVSTEMKVEVQIPTGVDNLNGTIDLSIYPNPSKGMVYIGLGNSDYHDVLQISVFSILGQKVLLKSEEYSGKIGLDLTHQLDGIYIVQIKAGETKWTKKVLLQKN